MLKALLFLTMRLLVSREGRVIAGIPNMRVGTLPSRKKTVETWWKRKHGAIQGQIGRTRFHPNHPSNASDHRQPRRHGSPTFRHQDCLSIRGSKGRSLHVTASNLQTEAVSTCLESKDRRRLQENEFPFFVVWSLPVRERIKWLANRHFNLCWRHGRVLPLEMWIQSDSEGAGEAIQVFKSGRKPNVSWNPILWIKPGTSTRSWSRSDTKTLNISRFRLTRLRKVKRENWPSMNRTTGLSMLIGPETKQTENPTSDSWSSSAVAWLVGALAGTPALRFLLQKLSSWPWQRDARNVVIHDDLSNRSLWVEIINIRFPTLNPFRRILLTICHGPRLKITDHAIKMTLIREGSRCAVIPTRTK